MSLECRLYILSVLLKEKGINLKPPNTGQSIVCLGKNTTSVYEMCFSSGKLKASENIDERDVTPGLRTTNSCLRYSCDSVCTHPQALSCV